MEKNLEKHRERLINQVAQIEALANLLLWVPVSDLTSRVGPLSADFYK